MTLQELKEQVNLIIKEAARKKIDPARVQLVRYGDAAGLDIEFSAWDDHGGGFWGLAVELTVQEDDEDDVSTDPFGPQ